MASRLHPRDEVKSIFSAALKAVEPSKLIQESVKFQDGHLMVRDRSYKLEKPCYVVAFGKAVLGMVVAVERMLGSWIKEGVAVVPRGIFECFRDNTIYKIGDDTKIRFFEGAKNNLPDEDAFRGAVAVKNLVEKLKEDDMLLVLISGGGSALLPLPKQGITLREKMELIRRLGNAGADVTELAKVRKRISQMKGGGLAELAHPCRVATLILSDVIGDPLDYIAGGPTVVNSDEPQDAAEILKKYSFYDQVSSQVKRALDCESFESKIATPGGNYKHVQNCLIGNNEMAARAAEGRARRFNYRTSVLTTRLGGDVSKIAGFYAELTNLVCNRPEDFGAFFRNRKEEFQLSDISVDADAERICFLGAGEPTVVVKGKGRGGRSQQLALAFSVELQKFELNADITFLSCGTDGIDGPTDAAGAIGSSSLVNNSLREGINPVDWLDDNDSYGFYTRYDGGSHLVRVGHTGTNVMDIHVLLINKRKS